MKKVDFKKLALMGIAGGCMLSAQGNASATEPKIDAEVETLLAGRSHQNNNSNGNSGGSTKNGNSCGSKPSNGCSSHSSCGTKNKPADQEQLQQAPAAPVQKNGNGCGNKSQPTNNNGTLLAGGGCGSNGCGNGNSSNNGSNRNRDDQSAMANKRSNLQQDSSTDINATPVQNIKKVPPSPAPVNVKGKNGTVVNPQDSAR